MAMDCFNNNFGNNFENNAWNLEHIAEKQQEILNGKMQGIMSIITLALFYITHAHFFENNSIVLVITPLKLRCCILL